MKPNRFFTAIGLFMFFLLCLVPSGVAQTGTPVSYASMPAQLALSWTFNSASPATGGFTVAGLRYWQIVFVPVGTVSGCGVSFDSSTGSGFTTGGIIASATIGSCASAATYANSSATTPTQIGQLTPSVTGTGSVIVVLLGYVNNPGAAGSASSTIVGPVDGSGYVEINCKTGCAGGNANGQATMANSAPVVISSNQSTIPVSLATAPTTPVTGTFYQTTQPVSLASAPTTPTQPTGFGSLVEFQQAVTASAVALATNSTHNFCVKALPTNALTVYVGGSGETTSTGYPLQAGDWICFQLSNSNLVYVIASATGSSVAVTGN